MENLTQGERVKELRKSLNYTLDKFGGKLGVQKSAISKIEKGDNNLTDQMLKAICREFDVNEEWLRTGEGEMYIEVDRENQLMIWAADVLKDESDSFRRRFVKALSELGEEEWELIEKFALKLLNRENNDKN